MSVKLGLSRIFISLADRRRAPNWRQRARSSYWDRSTCAAHTAPPNEAGAHSVQCEPGSGSMRQSNRLAGCSTRRYSANGSRREQQIVRADPLPQDVRARAYLDQQA
jgi:hypothetical protein